MRVAIIGCGVMGSAFARQFATKGHKLVLCDRTFEKAKNLAQELEIEVSSDFNEAKNDVDFILLAVKPKNLKELAMQINPLNGQILLSILAGVDLNTLKKHFPKAPIVSCMPNLALTCGEGVIALVKDRDLSQEIVEKVEHLFEGLGRTFWTEEEKIPAITALAGSGPAFVLAIVEAMVESGIFMGLYAKEAEDLVLQTILGSVALLKAHEGHPGALRWQISSPGGTTIAGLKALEESGVRASIMHTFLAAYKKVKETLTHTQTK